MDEILEADHKNYEAHGGHQPKVEKSGREVTEETIIAERNSRTRNQKADACIVESQQNLIHTRGKNVEKVKRRGAG